mmetsp:Transcript_2771/g.9743  ORF Transcript_2771/g.9743 Transcript_2771/m.9743 type:complete len:324 (+) Transcript_2771:1807-2778(+)
MASLISASFLMACSAFFLALSMVSCNASTFAFAWSDLSLRSLCRASSFLSSSFTSLFAAFSLSFSFALATTGRLHWSTAASFAFFSALAALSTSSADLLAASISPALSHGTFCLSTASSSSSFCRSWCLSRSRSNRLFSSTLRASVSWLLFSRCSHPFMESFFSMSCSCRSCSSLLSRVFSVSRSSSRGLISANFTTRSWGRNWHRLSSCTFISRIFVSTSARLASRPFSFQRLLLSALMMRFTTTGLPGTPLSSCTSTQPSSSPRRTKSPTLSARPRSLGLPARPRQMAHTNELLPVPLGPRMRFRRGPASIVEGPVKVMKL